MRNKIVALWVRSISCKRAFCFLVCLFMKVGPWEKKMKRERHGERIGQIQEVFYQIFVI